MLLLFWRGALPLSGEVATATADVPAATFVAVRQAVFGAEVATATATAPSSALAIFGTVDSPTATATAQARNGTLHEIKGIGPPTYVGAGTEQFTATSGANLSVPLPVGWQPEDVHILLAHRSDNTAMSALGGWTQMAALTGNNTTAQRVEVWMRRAQAGDANPVTVSFGTGTVVRGARIYGVRNCLPTTLVEDSLDASARSTNATADLTIEFPAVTTTDVNRFMLLLAAFEDDPVSVTTPTGFTAPSGNNAGSNLGNDMSLIHWYRDVLTAQTITPVASTVSGGGVGVSPSVGISLAFKGLVLPAGSVTMVAPLASLTTAAAGIAVLVATVSDVALPAQVGTATTIAPASTLLGGGLMAGAVATASAAALAPVVQTGGLLSGETATATTQAGVPTLVMGAALTPTPATATATAPASALVFGALVTPPVATTTALAQSPTFAIGAILVPPVATTSTVAVAATLLSGGILVASTSTVTASASSAIALTGAVLVPSPATATVAAYPGSFGGSVTFSASLALAVAIAPLAALPAGGLLTAVLTGATTSAQVALLAVNAYIVAPVGVVTAQARLATYLTAALLVADVVSMLAEAELAGLVGLSVGGLAAEVAEATVFLEIADLLGGTTIEVETILVTALADEAALVSGGVFLPFASSAGAYAQEALFRFDILFPIDEIATASALAYAASLQEGMVFLAETATAVASSTASVSVAFLAVSANGIVLLAPAFLLGSGVLAVDTVIDILAASLPASIGYRAIMTTGTATANVQAWVGLLGGIFNDVLVAEVAGAQAEALPLAGFLTPMPPPSHPFPVSLIGSL